MIINLKFALWRVFDPSHGENYQNRLTLEIDTIDGRVAANLKGA